MALNHPFLAGCWIVENNKVLILQQTSEGISPGKWGPPAGHSENSETPEQTAIRETREETGLDVILGRLISEDTVDNSRGDSFILYLFQAIRNPTQQPHFDPNEVADHAWVSKTDILSKKFTFRGQPRLQSLIKSALSALNP